MPCHLAHFLLSCLLFLLALNLLRNISDFFFSRSFGHCVSACIKPLPVLSTLNPRYCPQICFHSGVVFFFLGQNSLSVFQCPISISLGYGSHFFFVFVLPFPSEQQPALREKVKMSVLEEGRYLPQLPLPDPPGTSPSHPQI